MLSRPTSSRWAMPWADSRPGEGSEPIERSSVRKTPNTTTQPTSRMTTPAAIGFSPDGRHHARRAARPSLASCVHDHVIAASAGQRCPDRPQPTPDRSGRHHRPRPSAHGRHRPRARLLRRPSRLRRRRRSARRARLGHHGGHPLRLRRRLSPSPGLQHVEVGGRRTPARRRRRPASRAHPLSPRAPAWPMRCAACRASTGRCARSTDHGTHEAIYISDPDGNDLELCWDRPFDEWPLDGDGHIAGAVRRPRPRRPAHRGAARGLASTTARDGTRPKATPLSRPGVFWQPAGPAPPSAPLPWKKRSMPASSRRSRGWSRAHAERLLWRAGFGAPRGDRVWARRSRERTIDWLIRGGAGPPAPRIVGPAPRANGQPLDPVNEWGHDVLWWLDRMVRSQRPLQEKLTLFWHDHFATRDQDTPLMLAQNRMLRQPRARRLPRAAARGHDRPGDAALPLARGLRQGTPNENYARELMELFTLGHRRLHRARRPRGGPRAHRLQGNCRDGRPQTHHLRPRAPRRGAKQFSATAAASTGRTSCASSSATRPRAVPRGQALGLLRHRAAARATRGRLARIYVQLRPASSRSSRDPRAAARCTPTSTGGDGQVAVVRWRATCAGRARGRHRRLGVDAR